LKAGDVITKIDGNTVTSAQSLVGYVRRYTGGQEVSVTYVRDGVENTAKVTLQSEH
jgi:trypsin family serine protease